MRAFAFPEFGAGPTLQEIDRPEPAAGEVRVRVHAASVNGFDLAVAAGYLNGMMEHRFPCPSRAFQERACRCRWAQGQLPAS